MKVWSRNRNTRDGGVEFVHRKLPHNQSTIAGMFNECEVEAIRSAVGSMTTRGSDAGEGKATSSDPTPVTECAFKACSDSLRKRIDDTIALLEKDKTLTGNFIKAIEALREKEVLFFEKIDCGSFKESRDFLLPSDTNVYTLLAVVWRLSRLNFFEPDFGSNMLGMLMTLKESLRQAEIVRDTTNRAVEDPQCRPEAAFKLRALADCAKWERDQSRDLIKEYLPIP
ncbi:unnamed protein product [Cylicocyclus nassatus]|uniref:Uncharacterized protein n=1 Tax=Cylicocyclus nassatus TaxID=53992 RepID=A0AA36H2V3_CYLNA|nr:unnamed protein product [Cylicocyclus nassatus]